MKSYHDEERREGALGLKITSIQEEKLEEEILASSPAQADADAAIAAATGGAAVAADTFHSKALLGQQGIRFNLLLVHSLYRDHL